MLPRCSAPASEKPYGEARNGRSLTTTHFPFIVRPTRTDDKRVGEKKISATAKMNKEEEDKDVCVKSLKVPPLKKKLFWEAPEKYFPLQDAVTQATAASLQRQKQGDWKTALVAFRCGLKAGQTEGPERLSSQLSTEGADERGT